MGLSWWNFSWWPAVTLLIVAIASLVAFFFVLRFVVRTVNRIDNWYYGWKRSPNEP